MLFNYYLEQLDYRNIPEFLVKYLELSSLKRLKKVGYFCGMDYASSKVYNFSEYISRFDHSLTVALLTYKLTKDKKMTLAGLFHDIATPCFSHVIDYMNGDYEIQESTEEYTEKIIKADKQLLYCLEQDGFLVEDIIDFKRYSIVDNNRPKVCADRIDGIVLTGIGWTKNITKKDIKNIVDSLSLYSNEYSEVEIGFTNGDIAKKVVDINKSIDIYCHSKEDVYMMQLLANITVIAIKNGYLLYDDLYIYNEEELIKLLRQIDNKELQILLNKFFSINIDAIPNIEIPKLKVRSLNPIVNGKRLM